VLEASEDSDEPPKRVKMAGAAPERPSSSPPAGQGLSPGSTSSGGRPALISQETVDDDKATGSESNWDKVSETDLNSGGHNFRAGEYP
jgi:hypothetical protein